VGGSCEISLVGIDGGGTGGVSKSVSRREGKEVDPCNGAVRSDARGIASSTWDGGSACDRAGDEADGAGGPIYDVGARDRRVCDEAREVESLCDLRRFCGCTVLEPDR